MDLIDYPILTEFNIQTDPPNNIALSDPVLCFNNSNEWIVIDFDQILKTPIVWTKMYKEDKIKDVSIVVCPRTLRSCVFDGKLKSKYYDGEKLILENQEKSLIPIDFNISVDLDNNLEINKRYQISIQTLRNSLVDYYDLKYLIPNKKTAKYIINKNYLSNGLDEYDQEIILSETETYHPKTLIHIIQYMSEKGKRKITLLIGKDSSNIESKGYDNKKSGFDNYIINYENKIIEKDSFIMPILYYKAIKIYANAKKIIL
jgi:hypothetical protein